MTDAERIAKLEEENAWLRDELGLTNSAVKRHGIRKRFWLTEAQADLVLGLCASNRPMSYQRLVEMLPMGADSENPRTLAATHVCRIRKKIGFESVETLPGFGFRMTDEGRQLLAPLLHAA
jgi:DNA-binding response OmpR family regulator